MKALILMLVTLFVIWMALSYSTQIKKMIYPMKYENFVLKYSKENRVDPYLIFAIIKAESGFNAKATSYKKAKGLMQIMDATGKEIAYKLGLKDFVSTDLYDPETNIRIGCWHVNRLMNEFSDTRYENPVDLVIAAYNGGSRNVKDWLKDTKFSASGTKLDTIPFKETDKFLKRVRNNCFEYKKLYEK